MGNYFSLKDWDEFQDYMCTVNGLTFTDVWVTNIYDKDGAQHIGENTSYNKCFFEKILF